LESSWRLEQPKPLDRTKIRTEDEIREDLRQQLKEIHKRYLEKWVYPCR
jgi:hypothetical protein